MTDIAASSPATRARSVFLPGLRTGNVCRIGFTALLLAGAIVGLLQLHSQHLNDKWVKWTYIAIALDSSLGALSLLWRKPRAISAIQLGVAVSAAQVYLIALALLPGGNFTASLGWYGAVVAATCLSLVVPHWLRRPLVIASFAALTLCALVAPAPAPNFGWSPAFFFTKIILLVWLEVHLFQQSK